MNKNQKILIIATVLVIIILIATASYLSTEQTEVKKLKIVATFYPLAYFTREIGGEHVSVTQLLPDNTEVHSWQPRPEDILAVEEADIIVYNGANLDHWMETLSDLTNRSGIIVVETTKGIELRETGEEHNDHENHDHEHEPYDPHTWISPFIAEQQAQKIYGALIEKDPDHEQYYTKRWESLQSRLIELDRAYREGLSSKTKNAIFVTHAAFGYLADRYNFSQHGVYGLSADKEPEASEIANLVDMMVEHETYVIYVNPVYQEKYAQTLKGELEDRLGNSVQILRLYLMLGVADGLDYFEQQEVNLENLKIGLEA